MRKFGRTLQHLLAIPMLRLWLGLLHMTIRWQIEGETQRKLVRSGRGQMILAVWHGRILMILLERTRRMKIAAMVSKSKDGQAIADFLGKLGILTVRGSSHDPKKPHRDRGGMQALIEMRQLLKDNENIAVAITPDGPRGPAQQCKDGVVALALDSGLPIIPFSASVSRAVVFSSWDSFMLPLPFARGVKIWGEPLFPPLLEGLNTTARAKAMADYRAQVTKALNDQTARADMLMGRVTDPALHKGTIK